jgi:hypothetical protein
VIGLQQDPAAEFPSILSHESGPPVVVLSEFEQMQSLNENPFEQKTHSGSGFMSFN